MAIQINSQQAAVFKRYFEAPELRLCRLVLETSGIELDAGDVATPGFFFSMVDVFEKAVERALREKFGRQNVYHQPEYNDRIRVVEGDPSIAVTIRPDNVIDRHDAPWFIVNAKYKKPLVERHGDRLRNSDLYQAFTYAAVLDAPAVLVYPRVDRDVDVMLEMGANRVVRAVAMDLKCPTFQGGTAICLASLHAVEFSHVEHER